MTKNRWSLFGQEDLLYLNNLYVGRYINKKVKFSLLKHSVPDWFDSIIVMADHQIHYCYDRSSNTLNGKIKSFSKFGDIQIEIHPNTNIILPLTSIEYVKNIENSTEFLLSIRLHITEHFISYCKDFIQKYVSKSSPILTDSNVSSNPQKHAIHNRLYNFIYNEIPNKLNSDADDSDSDDSDIQSHSSIDDEINSKKVKSKSNSKNEKKSKETKNYHMIPLELIDLIYYTTK